MFSIMTLIMTMMQMKIIDNVIVLKYTPGQCDDNTDNDNDGIPVGGFHHNVGEEVLVEQQIVRTAVLQQGSVA